MPNIELKNIHKSFGNNKVLKDISFKVEDGEYIILLGPSGCGKTTLLKTMAGLYKPDSGTVLQDGADVTDKQSQERNIGFFFQHYHLFPHMTVRQNVSYGLTIKGAKQEETEATVQEKLHLVGLQQWADKMPHELSGGMQQRVALARALAIGSKLLLLDEPLNALDAKIGTLLRKELKQMAKKYRLTVIHVTPNQEEAMELADRIILLKDGKIAQMGTDQEMYQHPTTSFSAYFIGASNFIKAEKIDQHTVRYRHKTFNVRQPVNEDIVILAIRCEKILFENHEHNTLEGVIETANFLGKTTRYEVNHKGRYLQVETSKHPELKPGCEVQLYLPPEDLIVFSPQQMLDDEITVI